MRISQRFNAHGRAALRVGDVPRELREPHKSAPRTRGLKELFRNTQHYEPQINAYLESHPFETYEVLHNNLHPALHLEQDSSGRLILSLGKIERPNKDSVLLDYIPTLEHKFLVPNGIDENLVFKTEETALSRDFAWISGSIIKIRETKNEKSNA